MSSNPAAAPTATRPAPMPPASSARRESPRDCACPDCACCRGRSGGKGFSCRADFLHDPSCRAGVTGGYDPAPGIGQYATRCRLLRADSAVHARWPPSEGPQNSRPRVSRSGPRIPDRPARECAGSERPRGKVQATVAAGRARTGRQRPVAGEESAGVPEDPDPARLQVVRVGYHHAVRARHHLHCGSQRIR